MVVRTDVEIGDIIEFKDFDDEKLVIKVERIYNDDEYDDDRCTGKIIEGKDKGEEVYCYFCQIIKVRKQKS